MDSEVNEWDVEHQPSHDEEEGVKELYSGVLYNGSHDQVKGAKQKDDWEQNKHLYGPMLVFHGKSQNDQRHYGQSVEHPGGEAEEVNEAPNISRNQHQ